jgi:uncharacterized protein YndB with AHSA1/START domain
VIEGDAIVHEFDYPHPPERVWQAIVDADELSAWLMTTDFVPVVGRHFTMQCEPIGLLHGEVLDVQPPRRLSYRWVGPFGDTIVTFDLTPHETGTHVRLEHRGWNDENVAIREEFEGGWPTKLGDGLRRVLAEPPHATPPQPTAPPTQT